MFDPGSIFKVQGAVETLKNNHPKVPMFFKAVSEAAIEEGTIAELTIVTPDGRKYCTNLRLSAEDVEALKILKGPVS